MHRRMAHCDVASDTSTAVSSAFVLTTGEFMLTAICYVPYLLSLRNEITSVYDHRRSHKKRNEILLEFLLVLHFELKHMQIYN